ncbi:hypothetical protein SERLA73DRAFT_174463 [Serpula lacrymans var. lacrymans S7.3]|uniref:Uncharacterized protein n=2 Tax=Serpula lacrymans var. lacrymans TaxID=341189 RepID=F8PG15_SERL3|nr:uncharacterized protein SERLADRAFT_455995 [Serpula lacrymans var. lacrymans S7.9]EGO05350.1 hypothetical protein SERLA73DRAFT_174463 [Serpula lacrymans var. lacrymans S7.3]EGO31201.1 hypothetical protein SERLADRAFT_455995 [Serpula lacrymans var. lacrymans S7.9]
MGFVSMVILLPMYIRAKNHSVCMYIIWTSVLCLVYSINSIIWDNNVVNWAPVWCDISSRSITAAWCGTQTGMICIVRRLYRIMTLKAAEQSNRQARFDLIIDLSIGIGLPMLMLPLQYIVDSNRFAIIEDIGCFPATVFTPASIPIYGMWGSIFGLVSALYGGSTDHSCCYQIENS